MKPAIGVFGGGTLLVVLLLVVLLPVGNALFACSPGIPPGVAAQKGPGVEKAAPEVTAVERGWETPGSPEHDDHGDHSPLLFLLAGAAAGFIAGYFWRVLVKETGAATGGQGGKTS